MSNGIGAYQKANRVLASDRLVQARVLRTAIGRLQDLRNNWNPDNLNDALKYNQRFWTVVQADAMSDDCPLPADLRTNLLRLSAFVDRRTLEIYENPTPEKLDTLIAINISCAERLES
jgi:flagellar protein FlaF